MKEQCIVLFPYNAVNDDELSLEEGQIITVVSKEVEDKGWWKGEVDGRTGVFPVSNSGQVFLNIVNSQVICVLTFKKSSIFDYIPI